MGLTLRILKETDYAIRIIRAMYNSGGAVVVSSDIAEKESIPVNIILRIMKKLREAGIVESIRGRGSTGGGFKLKADLENTTLYDIVEIIEGGVYINCCLEEKKADCPNISSCKMHIEFDRINEAFKAELKRNNIKAILES